MNKSPLSCNYKICHIFDIDMPLRLYTRHEKDFSTILVPPSGHIYNDSGI